MLNEIKHKLKKFIIRYHVNQMIRGAILAVSGLLAVTLLVLLAEYFGYFNTTVRAILFFSYLGFTAMVVYQTVIRSLLRIYGVSGTMSDMEASEYIGKYLPEVSDKLTNLLQLSQIRDISEDQKQFLQNAINQKAVELKPFDFRKIVDFRINRKYLKYLAIPVGVAIVLVISAPAVITEPGKRLATFSVEYEKPQPFYISLEDKNPEVVEGGSLRLNVNLSGEQRPEKLFFESGNERIKLKQEDADNFFVELRNVKRQKQFVITDGVVSSREYKISILRKPEILGYDIRLDYPDYTAKKDEVTSNNGDLIVPCGTKIEWTFNARNTREIDIYIDGKKSSLSGQFATSRVALDNFNYQLVSRNEHVTSEDTMRFSVTVTPDQYPEIELRLVDDSSSNERVFVNGLIGDDYGFSGLVFAWKKKEQENFHTQQIDFEKGIRKQAFYHSFRKDTLIGPGEELEYYFEVKDNDQVKGPKSARSEIFVIKQETEEEIEEKIEKKSEDFKNKAKETSEEFKKLNDEFEEMRKKLVNKDNLDWEDKEAIRKLIERSEELQRQMEQLKKDLREQNKEEDRVQDKNEEILKKEEELKELMDKVLDEELLKKIEELKELLKKNDKDKIRESMEDMNEQNMDLEKELERSLELFKRLELEKELQDAINELDELKEEQQQAIEAEKEEKSEQQEKVNEGFDKLQKKLEEVRKKDKDLEIPMGVQNTSQEEKQLKQKLNEAMENLNKGKNRKGGENQQQAKQQMQKLSEQLEQMMMEMQAKSNAEDMDAIRELLENTVKLSVDQESLMDEFKQTSKDDPRFVELIQEQKDLKLDLQKVKDSLYAISKRQLMIQSFINQEVGDIDRNMEKAMDAMLALNTIGYTRQRDRDEAVIRQQYVMKGLNNIALMLSESLEQMKQQMRKQGNKMGNKSCNNPKPGQSSQPGMKEMQKQLNSMLDQMKKDMENGKKTGQDGKGMSERFARSAAQQREIRKKLEELRKQMQEQGNPNGKSIGKTLEEMEKTEEDLVNKILNENTLKRQQEILTRLLEHEKAKREQEFEKKRKSEEAKSQNTSNPEEFLEYKRIKEKETELLRMVPPELAPFYRNKLNEYYINLGR